MSKAKKLTKRELDDFAYKLFVRELEWIAEEYNRVCPKQHWAARYTPNEITIMNSDTMFNSTHRLKILAKNNYRDIELWEYKDSIDVSNTKPVFTCKITQMNILMAKIITLMGFEPRVPVNIRVHISLVPVVSDLVGPNINDLMKFKEEKGRVNMDLWKDIQLADKNKTRGIMSALAKKHGVSTMLVSNYRHRWVRCSKCGKVVVFDSKLFKKMVDEYGSIEKLRKYYKCKSSVC